MNLLKVAAALIPIALTAQQTVAPTSDASVGPAHGEEIGDYSLLQSWEFGYRFATVGGDSEKYRSDVNFGNGIRLLGSSLQANSRDGHGRWFDDLSLNTQGLGNDPYESATLRARKNSLYEYDMTWRQNAYFNPGLIVSGGEHLEDTTYRWQDHDLTLLPHNWYRIHAGYGRVTHAGPALTTQQEFDTSGDIFPLFSSVREQFNEYRLGGDITLRGFRFTIFHRWEYFREDSSDRGGALTSPVFNPAPDRSELSGFARSQPYRGNTPTWLGNLNFERKFFALNARMVYAAGRGDFIQNELAMGLDQFGIARNRQIAVSGAGERPVTIGNFDVTLLPNERLTFVASTSVSNVRTSGANIYEQFDNATQSLTTLNFQFLGIRLITASAIAKYRISKTWRAYAGFRYADRQIRSIEDLTSPGFPFSGPLSEQVNVLRAGTAGFDWTAAKNLQVHAEGEIGRNSNPFAPISLRNDHAIRARSRYSVRSFVATAGYQEDYNNNSIGITAYSSRTRSYSGEFSWNAASRMSFDVSYSKIHLDTIGGIAFFTATPASLAFFPNAQSLYISNIHAANVTARFVLGRRLDAFAGYSVTADAGAANPVQVVQPGPVNQLLENAQSYPMTYQTPLARLSWRLRENIRFNVGYQFYDYRENFTFFVPAQNYRAHTGYTSILWSF